MPNWEKREYNRRESKRLLQEAGISFAEHNKGAHLQLYRNDEQIDFWPGTGLFRGPDIEGRGVRNLIEYLKQDQGVEVIGKAVSGVKILTIDQIFDVAAHSKDKSLRGICEAIHQAVYKQGG